MARACFGGVGVEVKVKARNGENHGVGRGTCGV